MTTIAYRNGVMAADTRAYSGGNAPLGRKVKIRRLDDGTLVGASSSTPGMGELILDWYADGADKENTPTIDADSWFELLAVKPTGQAWFTKSQFFLSGPLEADYFVIGSGAEYAKGAMGMGAEAEEAVVVAAIFDPYTEGPFTVLRH